MRGFTSSHIHVFEADVLLPKFGSFCQLLDLPAKNVPECYYASSYKDQLPSSTTTFRIQDAACRVADWFKDSFIQPTATNKPYVHKVSK